MVDFLNAIHTGKEMRPNLQDGLKVTQVLDASLESAKLGKKVLINELG